LLAPSEYTIAFAPFPPYPQHRYRDAGVSTGG